jgi:hypothetical protein
MAKKARNSELEKWLKVWWARLLLGLVFMAVAYGFASWAIDSGNLLHYALTFVFLYFGVAHFARGIRRVFIR